MFAVPLHRMCRTCKHGPRHGPHHKFKHPCCNCGPPQGGYGYHDKWEAIIMNPERTKQERITDCKTLEELQALGEKLGYKPGWAVHVWGSRQTTERHADE